MSEEAYFRLTGDESGSGQLAPAEHARGPWSSDMLHGRLLAGLAAWATERDHGEEGFGYARLTVDLFRSPPMAPVTVTTALVRDGRRIRVVEASLASDGTEVAGTSTVMLRKADPPQGTVWSPEPWSVPLPDELPPPDPTAWGGARMWDMRPINESAAREPVPDKQGGMATAFGGVRQKRLWLREVRPLVEGVELSPFVRVAVAADFANPFANSGEQGLAFINADITLYLSRVPEDEWVGFETAGHLAAAGIAVGHCNLYDVDGPIGYSTVCAVANARLTPR